MTRQIVVGGVAGGIVLFLWGSLSHMVLGIGNSGIAWLPEEDAVVTVLQHSIQKPGFYLFPGMKDTTNLTDEEKDGVKREMQDKYRVGPRGVLIFQPMGREPLSAVQLIVQVLGDIIASLLAAIFLSKSLPNVHGFWARVLFVSLLGLFASVVVSLPYWNWYGFPTDYTLGSLLDQLIGLTLVGIVLAWLMRPPLAQTGA